ncbi:6921_t:CDS:2, partial [Ambispora leptoticha]
METGNSDTDNNTQIENDCFKKLPNEIIKKILSFLNARDIFSISLVNKNLHQHVQDKYVWQLMCINRFSEESINEEKERQRRINAKTSVEPVASESPSDEANVNWRSLYMKLSRPISFLAKDREIIWLDNADGVGNTHHWKTLTCDESEYGKAVFLDYVWWFDVRGTLPNVEPGTYDVIWRFKVDPNRYAGLHNLTFETDVFEVFDEESELINEKPIEMKKRFLASSEIFDRIAEDGGWLEYCLPDQITVSEERVIDSVRIPHSVVCKIYNHEGFVKRGL